MNKTIVTHGDGDGLLAAAVAIRHYGVSLDRLVITQPFLLDKIPAAQLEGELVVLDIAVNNRDIEMTHTFAEEHSILAWWDHHQGGEMLTQWLGDRAITGDTPSLPALIAQNGIEVPAEWLAAANACDRPTDYPATELSTMINGATKVAIVEMDEKGRGWVDQVQKAIVAYLVTGEDTDGLVAKTAAKYGPLLESTKAAAEGLMEAALGIVAVTLKGELVDKTALFMEGYKLAPVVVLQSVSKETGEAITTVATNRKDLSLVETFGLPSGAPFRVTITGGDHATQLERVKKMLEGK